MQLEHESTCAFDVRRTEEQIVDDLGTTIVVEVLECRGEIDVATAPSLVDALHEISSSSCVVDLGEVTFMGAAALNALAEASLRCGARGGTLTLRRPPRLMERLLVHLELPDHLRLSSPGS